MSLNKKEEKSKENKQHKPVPPKIPIKKPESGWSGFLTTIFIFLVIITAYTFLSSDRNEFEEISLSQLASDITSGKVGELVVQGENLEIVYTDGEEKISKKEEESSITDTLTNYGVQLGDIEGIEISIKSPSGFWFWLANSLPFIIPILFIAIFIWILLRQARGAGMQAFTFGQSRARFIDPLDNTQRITFKDVAGVKEAKEELQEIVDFLKNPRKFLDIGARIPKGVILMGSPGTGKTLLARAVAGEAGVPFFSISGSEFVEMFVGVGASRVRDLFKNAKSAAPAIVFVDEIDAVGRVRGTGTGGGNDEREQTLNQILVEMDGFEPNEKVIVIAATNRPDVLDPALLRPGRFDRRVTIDLPDLDDREKILEIHSKEKPFAEDVRLKVVAERTPGFSGADLQSVMNEAAILAARENRKKIYQYDLIRSIEKVMIGPERKSHLLLEDEKKITAYHEAGHALVASVLEHADPVHKISIISRGRAAGYTMHLPLEERKLKPSRTFFADIAVALGGFIAEKMIFKDTTTGPSNDLQVSTALARDMVTKYGMSDRFGPIALEGAGGSSLFGRGLNEKEYSEKVSAEIDAEVSKIVNKAHKMAKTALTKNIKALHHIAEELIEKETIEREDFEKILITHGIKVKSKKEKKKIVHVPGLEPGTTRV